MQITRFDWWYWVATVLLLGAGLAGWAPGFVSAIPLTGVQVIHFASRERSLKTLTVQILLLLAAASWEPLRFLYWIQFAGTTVFVLSGYCFLARVLVLLPWNRAEALTLDLVRRAFFSMPADHGIPLSCVRAPQFPPSRDLPVPPSVPSCLRLLHVRLAQSTKRGLQGEVME
jgi:hypothetical protein